MAVNNGCHGLNVSECCAIFDKKRVIFAKAVDLHVNRW